ncbi:MAG: hypothetical protein V8S87_05525 [Oscillospiraceae bacterium]
MFTPELGLGPKLIDLKRRIEYPTLARNAIKLRLEREMLSEEMRRSILAHPPQGAPVYDRRQGFRRHCRKAPHRRHKADGSRGERVRRSRR